MKRLSREEFLKLPAGVMFMIENSANFFIKDDPVEDRGDDYSITLPILYREINNPDVVMLDWTPNASEAMLTPDDSRIETFFVLEKAEYEKYVALLQGCAAAYESM